MAIKTRTRSARLLVVALVSVSLVTITLDYKQGSSGPLAGIGRAALEVMAPLQEAVTKVTRPIGNFFSSLAHLPSLRAENERLREEVEALRTQAVGDSADLDRYHELLALHRISETFEAPTTGALVIANGVSNSEWTITINQGSDDGVEVNMPVVVGGGLVGHVDRVAANAADVQLIIDPNAVVGASLVGETDYNGELDGQGPNDLVMRLVRTDAKVQEGQLVETSGYRGGLYPPGIVIGKVSSVSNDPSAFEKQITVRPAVDFSALDIVLVVLTTGDG